MTLGIPPGDDFVFQVVRNPRDASLPLVEWQVLDTRTKAVVFTDASLSVAQADAITRNQGV